MASQEHRRPVRLAQGGRVAYTTPLCNLPVCELTGPEAPGFCGLTLGPRSTLLIPHKGLNISISYNFLTRQELHLPFFS